MGLDAFVPPRIYKPNEMMAREGGNSLLISIIRRQQQQSIAAQHIVSRGKRVKIPLEARMKIFTI